MFRNILTVILAVGALSACTQMQDDWEDTFGSPMPFGKKEAAKNVHLFNFDTFICDGSRQLVVSFNPDGMHAGLKFDGRDRLLERHNPALPYTNGIYELYILHDGTLLVEKEHAVLFKHCAPLVHDPLIVVTYDYTPTMTPEEYHSGEQMFEKKMTK